MSKQLTANEVMSFMGELMARIKAHPEDERLLNEAREALAKLDQLSEAIRYAEAIQGK